MFGKHVLVVDKSTDHQNTFRFVFFTTISTLKKLLFFRAWPEKSITRRRHIDTSSVVNATNVASCKEKFTSNTSFCNCNCCVASCKKSRKTLYFSLLRDKLLECDIPSATCNAILSEWANQSSSFARGSHVPAIFVIVRVSSCEKSCKRDTPSATWKAFYLPSLRCKLQEKLLCVTWPSLQWQSSQCDCEISSNCGKIIFNNYVMRSRFLSRDSWRGRSPSQQLRDRNRERII